MSKLIYFLFVTLPFINVAYGKNKNISIIVTVPYIKDLAQNITCFQDDYKIYSLIPVGVDPHTFILSPADRIRIKKAGTIVQIGAGLEPWLDKINFDNTQNHLILSQHLILRKMQQANNKKQSELVYDPHIWQSPQLTEESTICAFNLTTVL